MSLVSIVPFRDLTSFNVFPTAYLYLYQQLYVNSYWNVGCYCLVAKLCPNRWDTMDCSPPDSSVYGIFQARILEWVAFPTPGDPPNPWIKPVSPALAGRFFTTEAPGGAVKHLLLNPILFISLAPIIGPSMREEGNDRTSKWMNKGMSHFSLWPSNMCTS